MSDGPIYTMQEKYEAVKRELAQRRHVYPRRIEQGHMSREFAAKQIRLMEQIVADYEKAAETGRLL